MISVGFAFLDRIHVSITPCEALLVKPRSHCTRSSRCVRWFPDLIVGVEAPVIPITFIQVKTMARRPLL